MGKQFLLQAASGEHVNLLSLGKVIHERICKAKEIKYVPDLVGYPHAKAAWTRSFTINNFLRREAADGDVITWLDADAFWVYPWADFEKALGETPIAMTQTHFLKQFHPGTIIFRVSEQTRTLFERTTADFIFNICKINNPALYESFNDQNSINEHIKTTGIQCRVLSRRWNEFKGASQALDDPGATVVRAFHGSGQRCAFEGGRKSIYEAFALLKLYERGITESELSSAQIKMQ